VLLFHRGRDATDCEHDGRRQLVPRGAGCCARLDDERVSPAITAVLQPWPWLRGGGRIDRDQTASR
jgi:hypothetical protein